jgi:uncharacterized DUF497 family protein
MEITFDHTKDKNNRARHGVSLADAAKLDGDALMVKPDTRRDYHELREIGYGLLEDRLYCAVIVQRGTASHIISLRMANSMEVAEYAVQTEMVMPTPEQDVAINAGIAVDPDTYALSKTEFKQLRSRPVGSATKVHLTMPFDADVIQAFRQGGDGWQARMNDALRDWLTTHHVV